MATITNRRAAKLYALAEEMHRLHSALEPTVLRVLSYLYSKTDPVNGVQIARDLDLQTTRVSYHMKLLGEGMEYRSGRSIPALGLIQVESDPHDTRVRLYSLTKKGRAAVEKLFDVLEAK